MIDLHCHMLPGIDDGPEALEESLAMARMAVADGIEITACTPHIFPGLYNNASENIEEAIGTMRMHLQEAGIPLTLVSGADVQLALNMAADLKSGQIPTLNRSRYFLFEPPHHVAPTRMMDVIEGLMADGYVPIVTHPERLTWIETGYQLVRDAFEKGAWIQLTAGAVTGSFGARVQFWSERMLDEGLVHILATDAHSVRRRRPVLSEAREAVARRLGEQAATDMVVTRPRGVLDDASPETMPGLVGLPAKASKGAVKPKGLWRSLWGR